jgi:hypothetical protein
LQTKDGIESNLEAFGKWRQTCKSTYSCTYMKFASNTLLCEQFVIKSEIYASVSAHLNTFATSLGSKRHSRKDRVFVFGDKLDGVSGSVAVGASVP